MTTKERLHQLVDQLPESRTEAAARFLETLASDEPSTQALPKTAELGGSMPELTGNMSTAEYLRLVRGG